MKYSFFPSQHSSAKSNSQNYMYIYIRHKKIWIYKSYIYELYRHKKSEHTQDIKNLNIHKLYICKYIYIYIYGLCKKVLLNYLRKEKSF